VDGKTLLGATIHELLWLLFMCSCGYYSCAIVVVLHSRLCMIEPWGGVIVYNMAILIV